jgi:predicted nucleotidyltransferase
MTPDPDGVRSSGSMRPATASRVAGAVRALRRDRVHRQILAVVVCGSAARGEERPLSSQGGSDIDLMVITASRSPAVGRRIARVLAEFRDLGIEGGQVPRATLRVHRTLLNYEARCNGAVVDGDPMVLRDIPMRKAEDIPRWEAVRLLFNRLFEHVKLCAGQLDALSCVAKTYEAIGEAQLVLQGRYRPSFAERWQEVRDRPLPETVNELQKKYLATAELRNGGASGPGVSVATARSDLLQALGAALALYTHVDEDLQTKLVALSRLEHNRLHRVYWMARCAARGEPVLRYLRNDPSLIIWRDGLEYLSADASSIDPAELILSWQSCPQILRPRVCP